MNVEKLIPAPTKIVQEAIIVLGGAIVAALIIGQLPGLRNWIKAQWSDTPQG